MLTLHPVTDFFVVGEHAFKFLVRGVANVEQSYWMVSGMPNYTVDFGDGTSRRIGPDTGDYNCAHKYDSDGKYIITITDVGLGVPESGGIGGDVSWLEILTPFLHCGMPGESWVSIVFSRSPYLTKVCKKLFVNNPQITNMIHCCSNSYIEEIPEDLFYGLKNVTTYNHAFYNSKVKVVSDRLFSHSPLATSFSSVFGAPIYGVDVAGAHLTRVEGNPWEGLNPTNFINAFLDQSKLEYCPPLWEWFPNAMGGACFRGCINASNYGSVPDNWK